MLHFENEWRAEEGKAKSTILNFGAKCQMIIWNFRPKTLSFTLPFLSTFSAKMDNCLKLNFFILKNRCHSWQHWFTSRSYREISFVSLKWVISDVAFKSADKATVDWEPNVRKYVLRIFTFLPSYLFKFKVQKVNSWSFLLYSLRKISLNTCIRDST